jgi:hypothetical protein
MYGLGPVPFNDGCAVASMDMSTEYEVILLTSEGPKGRCTLPDDLGPDRIGRAKPDIFSIAFGTTQVVS